MPTPELLPPPEGAQIITGDDPLNGVSAFTLRTRWKVQAFTAGKTPLNEDRIGISIPASMVVVADGIGSRSYSHAVAHNVTSTLLTYPAGQQGAIKALRRDTKHLPEQGGTCVLACRIVPSEGKEYASFTQAGDCRATIFRDGDVVYETKDEIADLINRKRNVVSNAILGSTDHEEGANGLRLHQPVELTPKDIIVLTSDGIHDAMETDEFHRIILSAQSIRKMITALLRRAIEYRDDKSIAVLYKEPGIPEDDI